MSIILNHVRYIYQAKTPFARVALQNIDLEIRAGEVVAVIGHTGSGKSTLVQHLNGLLSPAGGMVTVDGVDLKAKSPAARQAARKVGMVFQYPEQQLFEETVYDDIAFGPRNLGLAAAQVEQRVQKAMAFVDLDFAAYKDRSPFQLSGGQMRRVAIAGVVALEPEYLVLDEPSAGLDPRGRDAIFAKIRALHQRVKTGIVLVSHDMDETAKLADRIVVMNQGRIAYDGPPAQAFLQAELLRLAGVDAPQITRVLQTLQARGLPIAATALTLEDAVEDILVGLRGKGYVN